METKTAGEAPVKERPILFSAPMVRAILEGRKTQTRRVVKPSKAHADGIIMLDHGRGWWPFNMFGDSESDRGMEYPIYCPYGFTGDRMWVRETWADANSDDGPCILYKADHNRRYLMHEDHFLMEDPRGRNGESFDYSKTGKARFSGWAGDIEGRGKGYKPSIHMPRWASRIDLEITAVRVERLKDVSEGDAKAEGVERHPKEDGWLPYGPTLMEYLDGIPYGHYEFAKHSFASLWRAINGAESWDANPWVWVVEFKRVEAEGVNPSNRA
ncbi:hypothetical protein [Methylobacterium sp. 1030]|uniref:hypothetical protein n=1 Tax=Methylobacterium sp. 1030 TaxID=3156404 RepID=UPI0033991007